MKPKKSQRKTTFAIEDLRRESVMSGTNSLVTHSQSIDESIELLDDLPSKKSLIPMYRSSLFSHLLSNGNIRKPSFIGTKGIKEKILSNFIASNDFQNDPLNSKFNILSKQYSKTRTYSYVESLFEDSETRRASRKLGRHLERQKDFFYGKFLVRNLNTKRNSLIRLFKENDGRRVGERTQLANEIESQCTQLISNIIPIYQLICKMATKRQDISYLLESTKTLFNLASCLDYESSIYILMKLAKIFSLLRKDLRAVTMLKSCKRIATLKKNLPFLLKLYKSLGKIFSKLEKHKLSRFYFERLLQCAWLANTPSVELQSYEALSKEYFYLGDLDKANYFHERSCKGEIESDESQLKSLYLSYHEMFDTTRENKVRVKGELKERRILEGQEMPNIYGISSDEEDFEYQIPWENVRRLEKERIDGGVSSVKMMKALTPGIWRREANDRIRYNEGIQRQQAAIMKKAQMLSTNKKVCKFGFRDSKSKITISHLTPNRAKSAFLSNVSDGFKSIADVNSLETPFFNTLDKAAIHKLERSMTNMKMNLVYTIRSADDILKKVKLGMRKKGFISGDNSLEKKLNLGGYSHNQ